MASSRRVVITGMGLISPLGNSTEALWNALESCKSGVRRLESLPADRLPSPFGGEAWDFKGEIDEFGPLEKKLQRNIKKGLKLMCREIEMGVASAQLAISDAGLAEGAYQPQRTGVVFGSDYIMTRPDEFAEGIRRCIDEQGNFHFENWGDSGLAEVTPLWLLKYLPNMPASHIAIYNDLRGPNNSITLREASAMLAVGEAANTIARGAADVIVAGATGTRIHPVRTVHLSLQEQVAANGCPPQQASRPFDKNRTGMVLAEGAGAIVMEELESARARGAEILAEVVGNSSSTVRTREGIAQYDRALYNSMSQALRQSGIAAGDIGHVHAHGLSTLKCDADEARAIGELFGNRPVPVTAAKSYFGNLGAGSGVVELIASVMALQHGQLFPVLNYETPDPDCQLNIVREGAEAGDSFVNANVTPQGQASAVVVRKPA